MGNILKIKQKALNLSSFGIINEVKEAEKAADGVYVDSPLNRKLGRVGMPYKKGDAEKEGEGDEGKKENESDLKTFTSKDIKAKMPGNYSSVSINLGDKKFNVSAAPTGYGSDKKRNGRFTASYDGTYFDERWGDSYSGYTSKADAWREVKNRIAKIASTKEKKTETSGSESTNKILSESKVLGEAKGDRLNAIIEYAELDIPKDATDEVKRQKIAESYIKSAELKGSNGEIANALDEIVEDALSDYVPPKKEGEDKKNTNPFKS